HARLYWSLRPSISAGLAAIDGRSAQYSPACVVYEMLVGEPAFTGPAAQAIRARPSLDHVSPPSIVRESIPETMEAAILRALARTPADRFPTVIMFAEALARPSTVTAASRRITKASRTPSRERWRRGALWAVPALLLALAWAGRALWPRGRSASRGGGLDPKHIAVLYFEDLTPKK